jgi:hypothetical protein
MENSTPALPQHPRGYLSEESKRKFTIRAGILSAVFFLGQFVLPYFLISFSMLFAHGKMFNTTRYNVERSALWNNSIWLMKENKSYHNDEKEANDISFLQKVNLAEKSDIEPVCQLPYSDAWLLPSEDKLWIVSPAGMAYYQNNNLTVLEQNPTLGNFCKPFLYQNHLSVIEYTPSGFFLMTYLDNGWINLRKVNFAEVTKSFDTKRDMQVLEIGNKLHFFIHCGESLILWHRRT